MIEKLTSYVNGVFAPYEGIKSAAELKADLLSDLQERFRELKNASATAVDRAWRNVRGVRSLLKNLSGRANSYRVYLLRLKLNVRLRAGPS
jgi:hypothetical protein